MRRVQIDHVPDHVHATLRRRAEAAGLSLQDYLRAELEELAREPEATLPAPTAVPQPPADAVCSDRRRQSAAEIIRELRDEREAYLASRHA